jgi:hypothetical protein
VIVPAIHCAAVAIELYLKSLSGSNVDSPSFFDPSISIIVAEGARGHDLVALYGKVPQLAKASLENAASLKEVLVGMTGPGNTGVAPANPFCQVLGSLNGLFSQSRYPYEANSSVSVPLSVLSDVLDVFVEVIGQ